jgi:Domain of unknown function (DUF4384)
MLLPLFMLLSSQPVASLPSNPSADPDPPVHVWLNSDGKYDLGDRAKVYARAGQAGYLVVLRADPDGRVRVVFPLDPRDDNRVQGGKKYELKGRGGHEAFMANDTTGHGTVLAAVAGAPFKFDEFEQNGRWDLDALSDGVAGKDAEAGLLAAVQRMLPGGEHFDFDVATYVASHPRYVVGPYPYPYPLWWGYGPRFGFGFGYPYWGFRHRWGW